MSAFLQDAADWESDLGRKLAAKPLDERLREKAKIFFEFYTFFSG